MARIQAGPKGVGAWAVSTEGKIYWYPSDEGPAEAIQHDGSASSVFGQTDDLVVFVAEGGGVRIVVDQATHVAKTFDNIPDGSMTALDSSHLWAGSDRAVVFGTDAGGPVATFPLPDTATNVNCGLDVSMRAVDGHLALPYKDNGVSTLALLNLSAPEAVIEMTIPSRGGNFGCVRYSLDGTQFAVAETGESGSVLYIGTWDGQLTPIYESSEPYITVRAMK
jgi:hypothetical protein